MSIQPRSGEKHFIFGTKFKKLHNLHDDKWTADVLIDQYNAIITVLDKSQTLQKEEKGVENRLKAEQLRTQSEKAAEQRKRLSNAQYANKQMIKNLFKNHRDLQRVYPKRAMHEIIDDMGMRIFNQRKTLDRLLYDRKRYSKTYEANLLLVAKLQDQYHVHDHEELADSCRAHELTVKIENAKVRLAAAKALNRTCVEFIDMAMNDALYFNPILDAIQTDVREQHDILRRVRDVGEPAIENYEHLKGFFRDLNSKTMLELNARNASLTKCRATLQENAVRIRRLIRSDFDVPVNRYNRETESMLTLKHDCDGVEKQIQAMIAATASASVDEIFARFEMEIKRTTEIQDVIKKKEKRLMHIVNDIRDTQSTKEAEENDFTIQDIHDREQIEENKLAIEAEHLQQRNCSEQIKILSNAMFEMNKTCMHFDTLLANVGEDRNIQVDAYPNSYLSLPLLQYDTDLVSATDAAPKIETNLSTLFKRITAKIDALLQPDCENIDENFTDSAQAFYHDAILDKIGCAEIRARTQSLTFDSDLDKAVLDRLTIKAMSQRIAAEHARNDD